MSAKEMFEELGYELEQDKAYIIKYKIKHFISDTNYIVFDTNLEQVDCYVLSDSPFQPTKDLAINMEELQAINKQVEELGWLDEC